MVLPAFAYRLNGSLNRASTSEFEANAPLERQNCRELIGSVAPEHGIERNCLPVLTEKRSMTESASGPGIEGRTDIAMVRNNWSVESFVFSLSSQQVAYISLMLWQLFPAQSYNQNLIRTWRRCSPMETLDTGLWRFRI
jgi:hypothetical protein